MGGSEKKKHKKNEAGGDIDRSRRKKTSNICGQPKGKKPGTPKRQQTARAGEKIHVCAQGKHGKCLGQTKFEEKCTKQKRKSRVIDTKRY